MYLQSSGNLPKQALKRIADRFRKGTASPVDLTEHTDSQGGSSRSRKELAVSSSLPLAEFSVLFHVPAKRERETMYF